MELLFEIGCEELPARFVDPALEQIKEAFASACEDERVDAGSLRLVGTPRRLTLIARDLADRQKDLEEERTGPPANIAFDDDGEPTNAAKGFARGNGVDPDDLYTVDTDKGEYLAAKIFEEGAPTEELLPQILTEVIEGLHFPKSMRWGSGQNTTFGRPVRWIVALADDEVIPLGFAGVKSGNHTYGHRFSAPESIDIDSVDAYLSGLEEADVVVDPSQRRKTICAELDTRAQAVGGRIVDDPQLVDEVVHLIEKPLAVTLEYGDKYLELPREVLISSMRSHQRYFAVEEDDDSGDLRPACVVIYNTPVHDPAVVEKGNLKVLRARLDDARFFWDKDLKKRLSEHRQKLKDVIWIADLGTIFERTQRMTRLAGQIASAMTGSEDVADHARRAAALSKADLVTEMVHEFPDLQGVVGREYALRGAEGEAVAQAIEEQYRPKSAGASLPTSDAGACVAIAEKLDAIVGAFGVDMVPTASSDPYGLRRAALGVLAILRDRNSTLSIADLVGSAIGVYATAGDSPFDDDAHVHNQVVDFLVTRQRYLLEDQFPTDVVNSVLAAGVDDVPSVYGRVEALAALRGEEDFEPLALGFKRVVNILEKQADDLELGTLKVDTDLLEDSSEKALFKAFQARRSTVNDALEDRRWDEACQALIELKEPVDTFFDSVMVMSDDEALRNNRIALLSHLRDLFFEVADISKIQT